MCYKHKLGFASILLGVLVLALAVYQTNQFVSSYLLAQATLSGQMPMMNAMYSAEELAQYTALMQSQFDTIILSMAPSIAIDLALGLILLAIGIKLSPCQACEEKTKAKTK